MLRLVFTNQFKKDYKKVLKRGLDEEKFKAVVGMLQRGEPLPEANKDHKLTESRRYKGVRECHIEPDWLLVYKIKDSELILELTRTGSHSDLF